MIYFFPLLFIHEFISLHIPWACPATQTSWKSERQDQRGEDWQGDALFGHSQDAKIASTCSIVTTLVAFRLDFFLFTELPEKFWYYRLV